MRLWGGGERKRQAYLASVEAEGRRARDEARQLRRALAVLVGAIDAVAASPQYIGVFALAQAHSAPYSGPTFAAELDAAREIVRGPDDEDAWRRILDDVIASRCRPGCALCGGKTDRA